MDLVYIRKLAARDAGRRALDELTAESSAPLDDVMLHKAAQAEDPELFRMAMTMPGDPIGNYEVLGGTFKEKRAFGQPMFQSASASTGMKAPTASAGSSTPGSAPSGPQGGGGNTINPGAQDSWDARSVLWRRDGVE